MYKGAIYMIISAFLSVTIDLMVKKLLISDVSVFQIYFFRCLLGSILLFILFFKKINISRSSNFKLHFKRAFYGFLGIILWYHSLKFSALPILTSLRYSTPIFTVIFSIILLGEIFTLRKLFAITLGFIGALIVINPFYDAANLYLLYPLISAALIAYSFILVKQLSVRDNAFTIAFYFSFLLIIPSFILAFINWEFIDSSLYLLIFLVAILSSICQIILVMAFNSNNISDVMPFEYLSLIFSALFSYLFFNEIVGINVYIGGTIIFVSSYIALRSINKKKKIL
ncbi:MAG: DMT family transporter [Rickettsiales bacterium]|nr:DMT family transporter [Rickettsiales bacterium]